MPVQVRYSRYTTRSVYFPGYYMIQVSKPTCASRPRAELPETSTPTWPSFLPFPGRKERPTHSGWHSAWMGKALSSHVVCFVNRLLLTASSLTNSFILTILFIFQRTHSASSCKYVLCIAYSVSLLRDSISQSSLTLKSLADPTRTLRVDHSIGLLQPTVNLTIPSRRQVRHQPPATL